MSAPRQCVACGATFEANRRDRKYCGPACRKAAWRGTALPIRPTSLPGPIMRETRALLALYGAAECDPVVVAALGCAAALDSPQTPPGALVGLSKALPESLAYLRDKYRQEEDT